jgi:Domain of unknown function (DUF5666)
MEDYEDMASTQLDQPPAPRRRGRRWLLMGGLAFAFMLALGVGALMGSSTGAAQAAALVSGSSNSSMTLANVQGGSNSSQSLTFAQGASNDLSRGGAQGPQRTGGQCEAVTVSSVNGNTIVAKTASGSSVTIHTTASTKYNQAGKAVTASAISVGTRIHVMGTHNSDGSITATSIDIG